MSYYTSAAFGDRSAAWEPEQLFEMSCAAYHCTNHPSPSDKKNLDPRKRTARCLGRAVALGQANELEVLIQAQARIVLLTKSLVRTPANSVAKSIVGIEISSPGGAEQSLGLQQSAINVFKFPVRLQQPHRVAARTSSCALCGAHRNAISMGHTTDADLPELQYFNAGVIRDHGLTEDGAAAFAEQVRPWVMYGGSLMVGYAFRHTMFCGAALLTVGGLRMLLRPTFTSLYDTLCELRTPTNAPGRR
ncbi:hypothetical protein C2E23DRAFT_859439 [Lenzites betulinus]|nr:hypothetical protein C2E23DRAFT_859439 [Lenzites betulinus]